MWQQWVNLIAGIWVIVVPFLALSGAALTWTLVITGVIVAGLALWGALYEQSRTHREQLRHRTS